MKAGFVFVSAILIVDTFFVSYYLGLHSRSVDVEDPTMKPVVQVKPKPTPIAVEKPAPAKEAKKPAESKAQTKKHSKSKPKTKPTKH